MSWKRRVLYPILVMLLVFSFTACDFLQPIEHETVEPLPPALIPSLYETYEGYFDIGVAVSASPGYSDTLSTHRDLIDKHFNSITAENEMKPQEILPWNYSSDYLDKLDFSKGDRIVNYAMNNDKRVRGHVLVWHTQIPDWFFEDGNGKKLDPDALLERMTRYIKKVVGHYKGKVYAWDVVNEAIDDAVNSIHDFRQDSNWHRIFDGKEIDYIEAAFKAAHEADPAAKLYYNDFNIVRPDKRDKIIKMIKELQEREVPIHGIGIQGHWGFGWPTPEELDEAIKAYNDLGLDVQITELDIRKYGEMQESETLSRTDLEKQAQKYKEVFEILIKHRDKISSVTFWGVTDDNSWIEQDPLIFDKNKNPKDAFWAIIGLVK